MVSKATPHGPTSVTLLSVCELAAGASVRAISPAVASVPKWRRLLPRHAACTMCGHGHGTPSARLCHHTSLALLSPASRCCQLCWKLP